MGGVWRLMTAGTAGAEVKPRVVKPWVMTLGRVAGQVPDRPQAPRESLSVAHWYTLFLGHF
jgi:hypothetical protein